MIRLFALLLALAYATGGQAHETTRSYLTVTRAGTDLTLQFRVAFRDIEVAVWMDENLDGQIIWAEVEQRRSALESYVLSRIDLEAGGVCNLQLTQSGASTSGAIDYLDLTFAGQCPDATTPLTVQSGMFADIDPDHRMFMTASDGAQSTNGVLRAAAAQITVAPGSAGPWNTFSGYFWAGVEHLLGGADHIVFLMVLMLPAVAIGRNQSALAIRGVIAAVTGFTLAHGLTLTAGVTALLRPPPSLIEAMIALSIIITAVDNIRPFIPAPRAAVAAFFGLFHGFGFASALDVLHLGSSDFVLALVGFNVGIEAAQLGLVLILFPVLLMLSNGKLLLWIGSTLGGLAGLGWLSYRLIAMV